MKLNSYREGRTAGASGKFTNLKPRGSRFTDKKKFVFPNHENEKVIKMPFLTSYIRNSVSSKQNRVE